MATRRTRSTPGASGARGAVVREYGERAHRYDRRWESYLDASLARTLKPFRPREGDRVLDVGCGTGVLLERIQALHPSLELVGVDVTGPMLRVAADRLPGDTALYRAVAERLPFPAGAFDWIVSSSVLHYVPDPLAALEEAARVLRPGGRVIVTDWCGDFVAMKALDLYLRVANPAHVRTLSSRELHSLMERAGFRNRAIERHRAGWLWGLMTAEGQTPGAPERSSPRAP